MQPLLSAKRVEKASLTALPVITYMVQQYIGGIAMNDWKAEIRRHIEGLEWNSAIEAEVVEELSQHLEQRYQEFCANGKSPEEAAQMIFVELGRKEVLARELRRISSFAGRKPAVPANPEASILSGLWQDLRYGIRLLLRSPGYTLAALLTLTIGIGANTAVFSIVYGVLLRPLPFDDPNRLVSIWFENGQGARAFLQPSNVAPLEQFSHSFEAIAAYVSLTSRSDNGETAVSVATITPEFFKLFGIGPKLGRDFSVEDARPAASPVAIISNEYWQTRFGGDPNILGKTVSVPETPPLAVVGVLPAGIRSPSLGDPPSVWVLPNVKPEAYAHYGFRMYGRLKPGISARKAQDELTALGQQTIPSEDAVSVAGSPGGQHPVVQLMLDSMVSTSRTKILIFAGAVGSILLIVIVNLVGLELARLPRMEAELSIRTALGGSRWRLMQLMMLKTLMVGLAGGTLGIIAASLSHQLLVQKIVGIVRKNDIRIDATVLAVSILLSVVSSLLIAIVPALRASRPRLREMIHAAGPSTTPSRPARLFQDILTAAETAVALVLVIVAGLLINNLWRLLSEDLGIETRGVTAIRISLPVDYDAARQVRFFTDVLNRFKAMSNVESASLALNTPFTSGTYTSATLPDGPPPNERHPINVHGVTGEYFATTRVPFLAGRTFTEEEILEAEPVAIVSATLATQLWPGINPLGRRFRALARDPVTVIGVVGDVQYGFYSNVMLKSYGTNPRAASIGTERLTAYFPISVPLKQRVGINQRSAIVLARTSASANDFRSIISEMEPKATITPGSISGYIAQATSEERFQTSVMTAFGIVALVLTAIGIYSVVSYSVVRRTREIGIRMALGATAHEVFAQVCRRAVLPSAFGLLAGIAGATAVQRFLTSYLYAVQPDDGPTYIIVVLFMASVVLMACAIPARRVMKLDPVVALRYE
jgi:putative ABC transport system permease protein